MKRNTQLETEFQERLLPLCDGRRGLRGSMHVEVHEPAPIASEIRDDSCHAPVSTDSQPSTPKPSTTLDFISSDETLDRYDEIISASGWRLDNYRRNPVFQNAHQYGDIIFTLGKALISEVRAGRLFHRIEFATDVNPIARIAYGLYQGKFLNAVSVGFIPIRWEDGDGDATVPKFRRKYLEQELIEVSAVGIPANPNALQFGLKSGAVEKADVKELLELLRAAYAVSARGRRGRGGFGSKADRQARLLRFLTALQRAMKGTGRGNCNSGQHHFWPEFGR